MRLLARACYFTGVGSKRIEPKNPSQVRYDQVLQDKRKSIVFATGPSGTGKTMIACEHAVRAMEEKKIEKIIITRPAVSVEEQHGFLPGSLEEKMEPWVQPVFDVFYDRWGAQQVIRLCQQKKIEVCPLAFMRGRTFEKSWIIADEMQNATPNQLKMILTRIGKGSKMVVTGDPNQHDRGYDVNGLSDILERLSRAEPEHRMHMSVVYFTVADVERHPAIVDVLRLYGEI
jgi:phosphate starvation-inducible protein PhoH and related proteins